MDNNPQEPSSLTAPSQSSMQASATTVFVPAQTPLGTQPSPTTIAQTQPAATPAPAFDWNRYEAPKPTANRFVESGDMLDNSSAFKTENTIPPPSQKASAILDMPSHKRHLKQLVVVVIAVVLFAVGATLATLKDNSNTSKGNIMPNVQSSSTDTIQSGLNQALLKINRNTQVGGGKTFTATGPVIIQNENNSATAFKIQNAAGSNLFIADTVNSSVGIGTAPTTGGAALQVAGDISSNGKLISAGGVSLGSEGLRIGNTLVCTAHGCISSSSAAPTPSSPTIDVANLAYINQNQTFSGNNILKGDSGSLFQIQNSTGTSNLFVADTVNNRIAVGQISAAHTLDVNGDIGGTVLYQNGNQVCDTTGNCTYSSGSLTDSSNIARLNANQTFTGDNIYKSTTNSTEAFQVQNSVGNSIFLVDTTNGRIAINRANAAYTLDIAGSVNGTTIYQNGVAVCDATRNCTYSSIDLSDSTNIARLDANQTYAGMNTYTNLSNTFTGNGSGLTNVNAASLSGNNAAYFTNASNVISGTLNDSRLSSNVPLKNANNTFTGANIFALTSSGLAVQDASTPLGANLFSVTNNSGSTNYFSVTSAGAKIGANDVCTMAGNCAGTGGGVTTAGGTTGKLAKFTAAGAIGDSIISDDGSAVTIGGTLAVNTITPTATLTVGTPTQTLTLQGDSSTSLSATSGGVKNSLVFAVPTTANKTVTVPDANGTLAVSASGPLALDAAGNLTCPTCLTSGGGGGTAGVSSINSATGDITLAGTANQIVITPASGTFTFSLPQSIATASSPSFAGITIGGNSVLLNTTGSVSSTNIADGTIANADVNTSAGIGYSKLNLGASIVNTDINAAAAIVDTKLATISSAGKVADSALSSNVALANISNSFSGDNTFTGTVLAKKTSLTAVQVQKADGTGTVLTADTQNTRIAIAQSSANYPLDVAGDINSTTGLRVAGTLVCTSTGCTASTGSGSYIQNGTSPQTANYNITGNGTLGGDLILDSALNSPYSLIFNRAGGSDWKLSRISGTDNLAISYNNAGWQTALSFNIANGYGTVATRLGVGVSPSYPLDVVGDVNTTTAFKINGTSICTPGGCTASTGSGSYIQNGTSPQTASYNITGTAAIGSTLSVTGVVTLSDIIVVGTKASDPTCTNGAIYYSSATGTFRGCASGSWGNLSINGGDPAGSIMAYAGSSTPAGYFLADGTCGYSVATYSALYTVIGTTYGGTPGVSFCVPDLRGRTIAGLGTNADVASLGQTDGTALANRTPRHNSTYTNPTISRTADVVLGDPGHRHGSGGGDFRFMDRGGGVYYDGGGGGDGRSPYTDYATTGVYVSQQPQFAASGGSVGPGGTRPTDTAAYITLNYIIKY